MAKTKKGKRKYYFDYLPKTKRGVGKRRTSKSFKTLTQAKKEAKRRFKKGKIIQATFWYEDNILHHKIVGSLDTKGRLQPREYS